MTTFGQWTSPRHVEEAIINHCVKWGAEYIAEAERQFGIDARSIPVPALGQYTVSRDDFEKWPEDQTPAVLLMVPGLAGEPRREADRSTTAPLGLALGVITSSGGHGLDAASETAQIIGTALKQLLTDPLRIEDLAADGPPRLLDERYGDIPFAMRRTLGSARLIFRLGVRNWTTVGSPPSKTVPREDPYVPTGDRPTVETVFPTITNARRIP